MRLGWIVGVLVVADARAQSDGWRRELGEQGQPWSEAWAADGLLDGPWTAWHPNGFVSDLGQFDDGREEGLWLSFDDEGRLASQGQWIAGKPEGVWRFFHVSGAVASEGAYVAGLRAGEWVERLPDGRWFRSVRWVEGEPTMGVEEHECRNVNGLEWRVDLAQRDEGCVDVEGRRFGLWRGYHDSGAVAWERSYVEGHIDGPTFDWQTDGSLRHHGAFALGVPVGAHVWVDEGLTVIDYHDGSGPWRDVVDGVVREDGEWQDGLREGTWREWNAHGALVAEVEWSAGERVRGRFAQADLVIEGSYAAGVRQDRWRAWNEDGKLIWQGDYIGGDRSGEWSFARAEGDVALVQTFEDDVPTVASRWWPDGSWRLVEGQFMRTLFWPDGEVLRDDEMADGAVLIEPDDPEAQWQRALELQAWMLADPALPSALVATSEAPRAERFSSGLASPSRLVMPVAREMPEAEGGTNDAGEPDGVWTWFWSDGARKEQGSFVDGIRVGVWRGWDRSGVLRWQGGYVADRESGEWLTFYPSGVVLTRAVYRDGLRHGTWTSFHASGRVAVVGDFALDAEHGRWQGFDDAGLRLWDGDYRAGERTGTWTFTSPRGARSKIYP